MNKPKQNEVSYKSLRMVDSSTSIVSFGKVLAVLLITVLICLIYVPWQQSIHGEGKVTLLSPNERPQTVNAPINASINHWLVHEGDRVKAGDLLMELKEIDPKYLDPGLLDKLKSQFQSRLKKKQAMISGAEALKKQLATQQRLSSYVIPSAAVKYEQAEYQLEAATQSKVTALQNYNRNLELYQKGLRSKRDLELAEMNKAKAEAELEVAKRQTRIALFEQGEIESDVLAKIQDVEVKLAKLHENIAQVEHDLIQLEIEIVNVETRIEQRKVRAPTDGKVVRILTYGKGETVKTNDELAVIVPTTAEEAVELYIKDHDAPLLSPNRQVRLQFSGWPALQFSGWPAIAVGTFGGLVRVIDSVDDGQGRYRILVVPDQERIQAGLDEPWPDYPYLRPGTRANGWVMLETVSMGFELWRQFNAFPPVIQAPEEQIKDSYAQKNSLK